MQNSYTTYLVENRGKGLLLLLLFSIALYQFYSFGYGAYATICLIPFFILLTIVSFKYRLFLFWVLFVYNYLVQMQDFPALPLPKSLPNELLEFALLAIAIIDFKESRFERTRNIMLFALVVWCAFCTLEVLNNTCGLGINVGAWYTGARLIAFQMLYIFLVFSIYISNPRILTQYLFLWGGLALFAVFWAWKQQNIGLTNYEYGWLYYGPGGNTHLLQAGTLIRYWSIYSDAANYGIAMASTGVAFIIFGITSKIRKFKYLFLFIGIICIWGMFPSGTRTALPCAGVGFFLYIFLSKSFKIAIPFTILFAIGVFFLVFTNIGNGNQQIRRMRSAFDKKDASANLRSINQATMKKYMKEAPWGIGVGMGMDNVPANNKYRRMATIAPDSEYVFIWLHTGVIGITIFLITTAIILLGACRIVFFKLESPSLRGIGAGLCCAFASQQLGAYGNQVLMQYPNGLVFYGAITIVYILPFIEKDWIEYENKLIAEYKEKKRKKLEKKFGRV